MKFCLISVLLLLVPLASASEESVISKFLYDDGHLVGEGFDHRFIDFANDGDIITFYIRSNETGFSVEYFQLDSEAVKELKTGFAIETFRLHRKYDGERDDCKARSSKELMKKLMRNCFATIVLREMTEEEQKQMAIFKQEQKGIKTYFKVVYDQKRIQIKTVGINQFELFTFDQDKSKNDFDLFVDRFTIDRARMGINGSITEKSFVVERPATGSKTICSHTGLPDLKPTECRGQIALRPLTGRD